MTVVVAVIAAAHDWQRAPRLRASDRVAFEWAQRYSEQPRVVLPEADQLARRLAGGLPIAFHLEAAAEQNPMLLIVGSSGCDALSPAAIGKAADRLDAELVFGVLSLEETNTSDVWVVECRAGRGTRDRLTIRGPLVIVVDDDPIVRPRYVSWRKLRTKPASPTDGEPTTGERRTTAWQPAVLRPPRAKSSARPAGAEQRANAAFGIQAASTDQQTSRVIRDSPAACAQVLARWLAHHGFIESGRVPGDFRVESERTAQGQPVVNDSVVMMESRSFGESRLPRPRGPVDSRAARAPRAVDGTGVSGVSRRPRLRGTDASQSLLPGFVVRRPRRLGHVADRRRAPLPCLSDAALERNVGSSDA